jgi:hypothetical protein
MNKVTSSNNKVDYATIDFKDHIVNNIIKPGYKKEIEDYSYNRVMWKKRGMRFETCSKIFIGFGSIASFAAGVYGYQTLSFVSGAISTISLVFLQYANFSYKESKKCHHDLNQLLDNIGIKKLPELSSGTQDDNGIMMKGSSVKSPVQGSGYTVVSPYKYEKNPTIQKNDELDKDTEMMDSIEFNNFIKVKKLYEEDDIKMPSYIFTASIKHKNMEMFKYALEKKVEDEYNTLQQLIKLGGMEYTKEYFEAGYTYEHRLYKNEETPLYAAVCTNDIELVKYVYEKCPIWMTGNPGEIKEAHKNNNQEIIDFCIQNGSLLK